MGFRTLGFRVLAILGSIGFSKSFVILKFFF